MQTTFFPFWTYFDPAYEKSLLAAEKTPEEAARLVGWDWTHGIGVYALYRLAHRRKDAALLDALVDYTFEA